jgi:hypothetical protein
VDESRRSGAASDGGAASGRTRPKWRGAVSAGMDSDVGNPNYSYSYPIKNVNMDICIRIRF